MNLLKTYNKVILLLLRVLAAMGPRFYALHHNLYNSWQVYLFERGKG